MAQWHILARFSLLAEHLELQCFYLHRHSTVSDGQNNVVDLAKCKLILTCYALKCMTLRMVIDSSAAVR